MDAKIQCGIPHDIWHLGVFYTRLLGLVCPISCILVPARGVPAQGINGLDAKP